jgi:hypothetical protein
MCPMFDHRRVRRSRHGSQRWARVRLLDPAMAPSLQALARKPAGTRGTEDLVQRMLLLARSMGMQGHESVPVTR